jgi:hypothetical protein
VLSTLKRLLLGSQERTYTYLLLALILFVTVVPFFSQAARLSWIETYLLVLVLVTATMNVSRSRRSLWISAALGIPALLSQLATAHVDAMPVWGAAVVTISTIAFLGYLLTLVMKDIMHGTRHVGEKVIGAIVAYLLIGLVWSLAYGLVELVEPGSFDIPAPVFTAVESAPHQRSTSIFLYYSFITLTTLGYGDITPVGNAARTLSWIEAVVGQLFIAVTIARLVGIHAAESSTRTISTPDDPDV